jgi:hypothetical protein
MSEPLFSLAPKEELLEKSGLFLEPGEVPPVRKLLDRVHGPVLRLEDIWRLMDGVWDEMGLDNIRPDWERIGEYYAHPVWLLNGLFVETDPVSRGQREAWRDWLENDVSVGSQPTRVADYGGGFGSLAALLAEDPAIDIDIVDPHPPPPACRRFLRQENVRFVPKLGVGYDYLFCSDVLEHVPDPVGTLVYLIEATKRGGKLMIANNFFPVIRCHLPSTFHLRYSFRSIARVLGLTDLGLLACGHGQIFLRSPTLKSHPATARLAENLSRVAYPILVQRDRIRHFIGRTFRR